MEAAQGEGVLLVGRLPTGEGVLLVRCPPTAEGVGEAAAAEAATAEAATAEAEVDAFMNMGITRTSNRKKRGGGSGMN